MKSKASKVQKAKEAFLKKKAQETSIKEGAAYSVSEGFGLRYISAYAIALKANNMQISYLTSLPTLIGTFSQLFALKAMQRFSRKTLCFFGALLQALLWLPILLLGFVDAFLGIGNIVPKMLILFYTLLIVAGNYFVPAWTSWMKDIVPDRRGNYFSRRTVMTSCVFIFSALIGGFVLDYFKKSNVFYGFAIIFAIAFIARSVSAWLFTKKYEPDYMPDANSYFSIFDFIKKMPFNNFGNFAIFYTMMYLAVSIASPFFSVYMLKNLGFSYLQFIFIGIMPTLAIIVFVPFWGRLADIYGNRIVIKVCGAFIPLIPLFWALSVLIPSQHKYLIWPYLLLVESFSGFAWAGFNLSTSNFIYDAVTREKMPLCIAYLNIINSLAILAGASLGGFIASFQNEFFGLPMLIVVFIVSFVARAIAYASMINKVKEVRPVQKFKVKQAIENFYHLTSQRVLQIFKARQI